MDNLFQDLADLSWLNLSSNAISVFDYAMLPRGLTWLDLHQNAIPTLGNYFSLEAEFPKLAHIDASFNRLTELGPQHVPNAVEILLLNDNQIQTLVPYTFFKKTRLKRVDLTVNQIESIDRNALRLASELELGLGSKPPEFLFGGNPIKCDCHMAWFKGINEMAASSVAASAGAVSMTSNVVDPTAPASAASTVQVVSNSLAQNLPRVADLESIYCQLLYSRDKTFVPLVEAATDEFLCTYKTHCFALCHCCEYDACDCEMTCPDNCTCYHDNSWSKNIAECSGADFHDLPDQLPMDATEIFLDGNNIGELKSHTFIGRKNLKALYLNHSLISSVQNHTFNGLLSLEILHLEGNSIKELQGDEFHGLKALRELYLQNNLIRSVNNVTFRDLENLEVCSYFLQQKAIILMRVMQTFLGFVAHTLTLLLCNNIFFLMMPFLFSGVIPTWQSPLRLSCMATELQPPFGLLEVGRQHVDMRVPLRPNVPQLVDQAHQPGLGQQGSGMRLRPQQQ